MIVRDAPRPLDLIFALRGSILPRVMPYIVLLVVISAAMVWLHEERGLLPEAGGLGFTVFGLALSLSLGFRNNAAYDRWWEARKLWGGLLSDTRALAREVEVFVADPPRRHAILRMTLAFLHLHRVNLRNLPDDVTARALAGELMNTPHPPDAALDRLAVLIADGHRAGIIDGFGLRALTERLGTMAQQQSACERIATTPLPYVYALLIYRSTWLFCLLLPLGLIGPAGWLTPLFMGIVGYVFFGLAEVAEELSHPFGQTPNGLPLDSLCRAAEISLAPHLGEDAPAPLTPRNYFLN